jgi:hypothetical protein
VQLRIMRPQDILDTVDMVMMTVRQQDVRDAHAPVRGQPENLRHVPRGIHHGCTVRGVVMYQVYEIFHGPEFQGMDREGLNRRHAPDLMWQAVPLFLIMVDRERQ